MAVFVLSFLNALTWAVYLLLCFKLYGYQLLNVFSSFKAKALSDMRQSCKQRMRGRR